MPWESSGAGAQDCVGIRRAEKPFDPLRTFTSFANSEYNCAMTSNSIESDVKLTTIAQIDAREEPNLLYRPVSMPPLSTK